MINQFRTLLLNIADEGNANEHISPAYNSKGLSALLQGIYDLLFVKGYDRGYKLFIVHNLLSIIDAAGMNEVVTELDSRITYVHNNDNFKTYRISNPVISDSSFPLFVFGNYKVICSKNTDKILIQQNAAIPTQVSVYSYSHKQYVMGSQLYPDRQYIDVSFTVPSLSDLINLDVLGIRFNIGKTSGSFTDHTSKAWEFLIDAPPEFSSIDLFARLSNSKLVDKLLSVPCARDVSTFDNLWRYHPNLVYRLAGLIAAYVYRVNDL